MAVPCAQLAPDWHPGYTTLKQRCIDGRRNKKPRDLGGV
jgi:hypothetical protein